MVELPERVKSRTKRGKSKQDIVHGKKELPDLVNDCSDSKLSRRAYARTGKGGPQQPTPFVGSELPKCKESKTNKSKPVGLQRADVGRSKCVELRKETKISVLLASGSRKKGSIRALNSASDIKSEHAVLRRNRGEPNLAIFQTDAIGSVWAKLCKSDGRSECKKSNTGANKPE